SGSRAPGTGAQADRLRGAARSEPPSALTCRPHRLPPKRTPQALLEALYRDPTLRFNEHGRRVLRWFMHGAMPDEEWRSFLPHVPMHQAGAMAEIARRSAQSWAEFAREIERLDGKGGGHARLATASGGGQPCTAAREQVTPVDNEVVEVHVRERGNGLLRSFHDRLASHIERGVK